ncbi:MAG: hypothetical protein IPP37_05265 [Saprospiraceae bacterium]|nr:hypothetical protein [Saprospiraceae bacterium]
MHYVIDDVRNYTVNGGLRLFDQKFTFQGSYGIQLNNVKNVRKNTSTRNIMHLNASILPIKNGGLQLMYSNYSIDQSPGFAMVNDSFRLIQQTAVTSITPFYRISGKKNRQQFTINYNKSAITDVSPVEIENRDGSITTISGSWSYDHTVTKWGYGLTLMKANESFNLRNTGRLGGNFTLRKRWEKSKIFFSINSGYYYLTWNEDGDGHSANISFQSGLAFNRASSLQITSSWLDRATINAVKYRELRWSVNLIYSFFQSAKDGKKS